MPQVNIKVELISHTQDPEQVVVSAIRQCYSKIKAADLKKKINEEKSKRLIDQVIKSGHLSTIEHASFTFAISGISRACSHQLVRHRIASYSQQSQRYVEADDFDYIIPPKILGNNQARQIFKNHITLSQKVYKQLIKLGIEKEDARFLLPNATETKIVVTMNARALLNFFKLRLCNRAQWEIQALAQKMLKLVRSKAPNIFKYAGPTCETEKICWEGNLSCGKWKNIKNAELRERG